MKVILCVDERNGMLFLGRRLSWDSAVLEDILAYANGKRLWMNEYSASLFANVPNISVAEEYWNCAGAQDACFVENATMERLRGVDEIVIYRWNRHYPSDTKFPQETALRGMRLLETKNFTGTSHEKITREVYGR